MASRMNRSGVALEVGAALKDLGRRLSIIEEYTGRARAKELAEISNRLTPLVHRLASLVEHCRAAKSSYPNYPALRKAIANGGEAAYDSQKELEELVAKLNDVRENVDTVDNSVFVALANSIHLLGQRIRLIEFTPPQRDSISPAATPAGGSDEEA